jgi:protein-tyrosine phosphatase
MAATTLLRVANTRRVTITAASCGLLAGGQRPPSEMVATMAARGIDLRDHLSRQLTVDMVEDASLVIGMAREHVREVVSLRPDSWGRTFTLKELVRRAADQVPRGQAQRMSEWLETLHEGRKRVDLLGSSPADDVADPVGGPRSEFEATANEIEQLISGLVDRAWPS